MLQNSTAQLLFQRSNIPIKLMPNLGLRILLGFSSGRDDYKCQLGQSGSGGATTVHTATTISSNDIKILPNPQHVKIELSPYT